MKRKNLIIASIIIISAYLGAAMFIGGDDWLLWIKTTLSFIIPSLIIVAVIKVLIFGSKK